jgi:hypothetical protein
LTIKLTTTIRTIPQATLNFNEWKNEEKYYNGRTVLKIVQTDAKSTFSEHIHDILWTHTWHSLKTYMTFSEHIHDILWTHTWHSLNTYMTFSEHIHDILWTHTWHSLNTYMTFSEHIHDILWTHTWPLNFPSLIRTPGADPGFQVRGTHLKKIAPSGGRREHFWGISCEKSRFYAKKSYFFQF